MNDYSAQIKVFSLRKGSPEPPSDFIKEYVDNSSATLGNPHVMVKNNLTERARVLSLYSQLLEEHEQNNGYMWQTITKLAQRVTDGEKIALMCWCAPKPCHGDIIRSAILNVIKLRKNHVTN